VEDDRPIRPECPFYAKIAAPCPVAACNPWVRCERAWAKVNKMPNPLAQIYRARQYRPDYFEGFEEQMVDGLTKGELLNVEKCPWLKNFMHEGFERFEIDEITPSNLIVIAYYKDGTHWVATTARMVAQSRA
jgi:hypothetical protein